MAHSFGLPQAQTFPFLTLVNVDLAERLIHSALSSHQGTENARVFVQQRLLPRRVETWSQCGRRLSGDVDGL